ncbi:MAG: hypothetical protein GC180_04865 [Bacteroidetes bacterium]|nr:hypothetical protein [Bacteroidota bacterium]
MLLLFALCLPGVSTLFLTCNESGREKEHEFYGKIIYKVSVGGQASGDIISRLQGVFGDSIAVSFTDKGYKLEIYSEAPITEWYDNDKGLIYFVKEGVDTLYYEVAKEENMLRNAVKREEKHQLLGRECNSYFMEDNQFQIEMWYDSTMHVSPKRFSRLYQGHYNRYYADCQAPYLLRSLVMFPVNIRIEAFRIESSEEPDPAWTEMPDYPKVAFNSTQ